MSILKLHEIIPKGGLGRWLNDDELRQFQKLHPEVNDPRVRVRRIDREDEQIGSVVYATSTAWKECAPLLVGIAKMSKKSYNSKCDITYNSGLEYCYGAEPENCYKTSHPVTQPKDYADE